MIAPRTNGRLSLSTSSRRPWLSKTASFSRCSSKASWYGKPEQPPPRTPTRSPARATSASCAARNSRTFSAPLSLNEIITIESVALYGWRLSLRLEVPTSEEIKQRIEAAIPGARAAVEDYTGGGDHFRATVTAEAFAGRSRIEQHRLVYDVFGAEIGGAIHALSLKTEVG